MQRLSLRHPHYLHACYPGYVKVHLTSRKVETWHWFYQAPQTLLCAMFQPVVYRGYYTVARRYEFYFRVAKQYFTNECSEWVKYCFCHEKIKFISSNRRVMFFLLYRQKNIDKIIGEMTEITSSINSRVRLWKITHSDPGCSFYEFYEWYIFQ